ncbi:DUF5776 domain-containing protein [Levilactobacillus yiduensis]|uniref:DUF5776 domain-containing protein n=1 Tax=Levilactobacillus yiduensis TaxID=2953880 RepID=UPI000EF2D848|nr:DUF5776 domain-containing protein [Levilactobacillus yiduensis]AYM01821.1 hypothetical protein D8911_02000 [Levilactobacillus brevis]
MKRKSWLKRIFTGIGLIAMSVCLGIIAGGNRVAYADDVSSEPEEANIRINIFLRSPDEDKDKHTPPIQTLSSRMDVKKAKETSVNDFIKKHNIPIYAENYSVYDHLNIILTYVNHPNLRKQAIEEYFTIFKPSYLYNPDSSMDLAEQKAAIAVFFEQEEAQPFIDYGYQGMVLDKDKTDKEARNQFLTLTPAKGGGYTAQDFYVYLKPETNPVIVPSKVDQSALTADDHATIVSGENVDAATFHARALNSDGEEIPVTVAAGEADLKVPGTYTITLTADNGKTKTVTLTVTPGEAAIEAVAPKKTVVYGLKTIYLYQKPTFNQRQRVAKYRQVKRTQRPLFVVTGYAKSKSGAPRYQVKDVNHGSKTAGKTGYITVRKAFVAPAYYQKTPKKIKVINPKGINSYQRVGLTKKVKHVKAGQTLNVIARKQHNLTTRFVLANGQYVSANKKLVLAIK